MEGKIVAKLVYLLRNFLQFNYAGLILHNHLLAVRVFDGGLVLRAFEERVTDELNPC